MANALLDFVMSLVRDPDAAARYAADPAGSIADAHLTDVTSVDVNNLIPMVADSMSMAAPSIGAGHAVDANVWTSGAATAAFDAFHAAVPDPSALISGGAGGVITQPAGVDHAPVVDVPADGAGAEPAPHQGGLGIGVDDPPLVDQPVTEWNDTGDWQHLNGGDSHAGAEHLGFDLF